MPVERLTTFVTASIRFNAVCSKSMFFRPSVGTRPNVSSLPEGLDLILAAISWHQNLFVVTCTDFRKQKNDVGLLQIFQYSNQQHELCQTHGTPECSNIWGSREASYTGLHEVKIMSERPVEKDLELTNYYPRHKDIDILMEKLRFHGLYRDEHQDFQEEMIRLRELRGKGKRRKGEGKKE